MWLLEVGSGLLRAGVLEVRLGVVGIKIRITEGRFRGSVVSVTEVLRFGTPVVRVAEGRAVGLKLDYSFYLHWSEDHPASKE